MPNSDQRLETFTPEDELRFKLIHELETKNRHEEQHLQTLFDLNKRFESVKSVMREVHKLSKEWGEIHAKKDKVTETELAAAIAEYAKKVVALENELLELEAAEVAKEEEWWLKQKAEIKRLVAHKDPSEPRELSDQRETLRSAYKKALEFFVENKKSEKNVESLRQYGRLKLRVVELVKDLGGKIDEALEKEEKEKKGVAEAMAKANASQQRREHNLASKLDTTDEDEDARAVKKKAQTPPPIPADAKPARKKGVPPPPPAEAFVTPAERRAARQRDTLTTLKAVSIENDPEISPDEAWAAENREAFDKADFRLFTADAMGLINKADHTFVVKMGGGAEFEQSLVLDGTEPRYGAKLEAGGAEKAAQFVVLDYGSLHLIIKPAPEGDVLQLRIDHVGTMRSVPYRIENAENLKDAFSLTTDLLAKTPEELAVIFAPDSQSVRDTLVDQPAVSIDEPELSADDLGVPDLKKGWWGKLKDVFSNKEVRKKGAKALFYDTPTRILGVKALTDLVGAIPQIVGRGGEGFGDLAQFLKNKKEVAAELDSLKYSVGQVVLELGELVKDSRAGDSVAERQVMEKLARLDALIADIKNISATERQTLKHDLQEIIMQYGKAQKKAEAELHKRASEILSAHVRNQMSKLSIVRDWTNLALTGAGMPIVRAVAYGGIGLSELFLRTKREQKEGTKLTAIAATAAKESFRALMFKGRKEGSSALTRGVEGFAAVGQALSVFGIGMASFGGEHPNGSEGVHAIIHAIEERGYKGGGLKVWDNFIDRSELLMEKVSDPMKGAEFAAGHGQHGPEQSAHASDHTEMPVGELSQEQAFVKELLAYPTFQRNREALREVLLAAGSQNHHGQPGRIVGEVSMLTFKALVEHGASQEELVTFVRDQNFTTHQLEHLKGLHLTDVRSGKTLDAEKVAHALIVGLNKKDGGVEAVFAAKGANDYRHALHQLHGNRLRLQGNVRLYGFDKVTGEPILGGAGRAQVLSETITQRANNIPEGQVLRIVGKSGMQLGTIKYHAGVSDEALREWKQMGAHIYPAKGPEVSLGTHATSLQGSDVVRRYMTTPDGKREFLVGTVDMQPATLPTGDTLATAKGEMLSVQRTEHVVRTIYSRPSGEKLIPKAARLASNSLEQTAGAEIQKVRESLGAAGETFKKRLSSVSEVIGLKRSIKGGDLRNSFLAFEQQQAKELVDGVRNAPADVLAGLRKADAAQFERDFRSLLADGADRLGLPKDAKVLDLLLSDRSGNKAVFIANGGPGILVRSGGKEVLAFVPGIRSAEVDTATGVLRLEGESGQTAEFPPAEAAEFIAAVKSGQLGRV